LESGSHVKIGGGGWESTNAPVGPSAAAAARPKLLASGDPVVALSANGGVTDTYTWSQTKVPRASPATLQPRARRLRVPTDGIVSVWRLACAGTCAAHAGASSLFSPSTGCYAPLGATVLTVCGGRTLRPQDEVVAHVRVPASSKAAELTVTLKAGRLEVRGKEGEALAGELLHPVVEDDDGGGDVDWELTDWPAAAPHAASSRRVTVTLRKVSLLGDAKSSLGDAKSSLGDA
jgi:hypothetical protein